MSEIDKKYKRCMSCGNFLEKDSNKNWVVCTDMPLSVVENRTSDSCGNYKKALEDGTNDFYKHNYNPTCQNI